MRSAVDFLPSSMTLLMTCWTSLERWTGSGSIGRTPPGARRGTLLGLHAVLRARLAAVAHAGGVERPAHDLVAHARQVLDAAAAHEHHGVLLEVVALARDVGRDLDAARDPDARDLAQRRVRLLGRGRVHARADPAPLGRGDLLLAALARLQARRRELLGLRVATLADQLRGRRHAGEHASSGWMPGPGHPRLSAGGRALERLLGRDDLEPLVAGDGLVGDAPGRDVEPLHEARV